MCMHCVNQAVYHYTAYEYVGGDCTYVCVCILLFRRFTGLLDETMFMYFILSGGLRVYWRRKLPL